MKESEYIEFKKSTIQLKEALISIAAILNKHKKGILYFGIRNDGTPIGQELTDKTLRDVSKAISDCIEPKIYPEIKSENIGGKECIKVLFEGHDQPYFAYGRAYMRMADEDRHLSVRELESFILCKNAVLFDSLKSDCTIDDIDEETIRDFVSKANQAKRISYHYTTKVDVLMRLGLLVDGTITRAGKLLFSNKEPLELQAAVFASTNKLTFLDIRQFKGNIFQLLRMSEAYIKEHIDWRAKLETRTREEIPEIPVRAITEALVNSFCHRDYQVPESNKIAVYKDRVEVWNPGEFPSGYTPLDYIKADLPSILRNPAIASVLYLSADIEKWGSGIKRIKEACDSFHVPVEFDILEYGFSVTFGRNADDTASNNTGEKTREKTREKILAVMSDDPSVTLKELVQLTGITRQGIEWQISKLKRAGRLNRVGPDKGGHWEIVPK